MSYTMLEAQRFEKLFAGNSDAYGSTKVGDIVNGKAESNSRLIYETPSTATYLNHLNGQESIGIAPIDTEGDCNFGAIDIDNYDYNLQDIVEAIADFNLPLCPCYSKSKKLHLYVFFSEPTPAAQVQELLSWYVGAFACKPKTEIFPKQSKASDTNKFYSWINLPYYEAENESNHRKMVWRGGQLLPLEKALDMMEARRKTIAEHWLAIKSLDFYDAPPCILSGILLRDVGPGQRNNWLFSAGVYYRLKDENCDLAEILTTINNSLRDPIPTNELNNTIIKGFQRKSYFYMCNALERCNKTACRKCQYGIESKESTGLDYGDLTQVMTDPPYYEWIVNGQKLVFYSETEMLQQTKFRALCLRQLHLVPRHVKDDRWSAILTRACENISVITPEQDEFDFSTGSTFLDLTYAFFNARRRANNLSQVALGRVFEDLEEKEYVFSAKSYVDFLRNKNDLKTITSIEMRTRLQNMGAYKNGSVWRIPIASIPSDNSKIDIDFGVSGEVKDEFEF